MPGEGSGGVSRALRVLLLVVAGLAALQYMFGSALEGGGWAGGPAALRNPAPDPPRSHSVDPKQTSWPKRARGRPAAPATAPAQQPPDNATHPPSISTHPPTNTTLPPTNRTHPPPVETRLPQSPRSPPHLDKPAEPHRDTATPPQLKPCVVDYSNLGPVRVDKKIESLEGVEKELSWVLPGGRHAPAHCLPTSKVAIVVPFRDRDKHLPVFLKHMHPFLARQDIDYGIFIVEQAGTKPFNRAKLMNVGFVEAQRSRAGGWDCFVFHDLDLIPLDTRNLYTCPRQPRHMSSSIDKMNFTLPYAGIFGGVSALTVDQMLSVNGFSNKYWGWGGEDDDMYRRLRSKKYYISRYPMSISRYTMLDHAPQSILNDKRFTLLTQTQQTFQQDGLSSLEYRPLRYELRPLYTSILADIDAHS